MDDAHLNGYSTPERLLHRMPKMYAVAGGHEAIVTWDWALQTFIAQIDVFDAGRLDRATPPTATPPGGAWCWLHEQLPAPVPIVTIGDRFGQHLTVDSLRNEMTGRLLAPDDSSWCEMLAFGEEVVRRVGDVLIAVGRRGCGSEHMEHRALQLVVHLPNGRQYVAPPRLVDANSMVLKSAVQPSVLDVSARIVELVWGPSNGNNDGIVWELAYEVLLPTLPPFALVAASIADWISYGSGLRWVRPYGSNGTSIGEPPRFRQLELRI